jgi:tRNA nucleotidyltransferase (CCA-adding enzyme)
MRDGAPMALQLPPGVADVLARIAATGAEAVLVGGCVRDLVRGERPTDWDVATSAQPEQVAAAFPGSSWANPFGTVTITPADGSPAVEVTTYRIEGGYSDHRRPDHVRWGTSLEEDLARRDFTINAMAWRPADLVAGRGTLVDPTGGAQDLEAGLLRAVGDPDARFSEDALRLVRAVRFATRLGLTIDAATEAAARRHARAVAGLSGERVRDELFRMLAADAPPSIALGRLEELGLLEILLPELTALRGVPQAKRLAGDALDHSLRTADALPAADPTLRLAGLLHDLGKATTLEHGHFIGHEREGAAMAEGLLRRLRVSREQSGRITRLIRQHMFAYGPEWSDAAVRRFVRRVGADLLDDLFALRRADNVASGVVEPAQGGSDELEGRAFAAVRGDPLEPRQLAVNGDILREELGMEPGPALGALLDRLLEAVLDDPILNRRDRLLQLARAWALAARGDQTHHSDPPPPAAER